MTLKTYLTIMIMMTLLCWSAWAIVLFTIDPSLTNWIGLTLFYSSLFLSIIGSAAIIGFLLRFVILKQKLAWQIVKEAFRQSFLFAFLIVISLILLSHNLFTWLNLFFLIAGLTILEFFMLSMEKK
ncbi:hypothetical protein KAR28_06145 [Candidatus Parcubacteria bacterium]|nr:hypothetical protein [Candidatus Parcubacteria bacterium]